MGIDIWKKIRDYVVGTLLGVVFCLVVGKMFLVPDWTVVEILKLIVDVHTGWSW